MTERTSAMWKKASFLPHGMSPLLPMLRISCLFQRHLSDYTEKAISRRDAEKRRGKIREDLPALLRRVNPPHRRRVNLGRLTGISSAFPDEKQKELVRLMA
jgi:hypothetical protein